jgi:hypothetical protein
MGAFSVLGGDERGAPGVSIHTMDHNSLMMIAGSQKNIGMTVLLSQDKRAKFPAGGSKLAKRCQVYFN